MLGLVLSPACSLSFRVDIGIFVFGLRCAFLDSLFGLLVLFGLV